MSTDSDETAGLTPSAAKLQRILGLASPPDVDTVRDRAAAEEQAGDGRGRWRSPGDQEGSVAERSCHGRAGSPLFRSDSPAGAEARMNGKGSTRVKCCKDSDRPSEGDGGKRSPTPSVDKLNRLIGPSPTPGC